MGYFINYESNSLPPGSCGSAPRGRNGVNFISFQSSGDTKYISGIDVVSEVVEDVRKVVSL